MYRYRVTLRPSTWVGMMPPVLTREALAQAISGAAVRGLSGSAAAGYDLEIQLKRPTHADALDEIANTAATFGLDVAQAYITEVTTELVTGMILGGAGGAVGGGATQNPGAAVFSTLIGMVVGGLVGSARERVVAEYLASRPHPYGQWSIYPIDRRQQGWSPAADGGHP